MLNPHHSAGRDLLLWFALDQVGLSEAWIAGLRQAGGSVARECRSSRNQLVQHVASWVPGGLRPREQPPPERRQKDDHDDDCPTQAPAVRLARRMIAVDLRM